jgi:hypothetical protein
LRKQLLKKRNEANLIGYFEAKPIVAKVPHSFCAHPFSIYLHPFWLPLLIKQAALPGTRLAPACLLDTKTLAFAHIPQI